MNTYRNRVISDQLQHALTAMPVVAVTGARQTGKTTLVRDLCPGGVRAFFSLDHIELLEQLEGNADSFLDRAPVTIDEVQRLPELLLAVKRHVDSGPRRAGEFLLTGSANISLLEGVADSLAGRAYYLELHPFCPVEWAGKPERLRLLDLLFSSDFDPMDWAIEQGNWIPWALKGGFPAALLQTSDRGRDTWFAGYVQTYLERDLRQIQDVSSLPDFRRLMRLAATRVGRLLNQAEIGRDAGLTQPTAHRYLNLLDVGYQIARIDPFAVNTTSQVVKSKKLFWRDCGLAAWLARYRSPDELQGAPDLGFWLEQAFFQTLAVWVSLDPTRRHIYYWRDRSGNELDFILERDGDIVAVEIKAGEKVDAADAKGLKAFKEKLKVRRSILKNSVVFHTGTLARPLADAIYSLPLGCFFPAGERT